MEDVIKLRQQEQFVNIYTEKDTAAIKPLVA